MSDYYVDEVDVIVNGSPVGYLIAGRGSVEDRLIINNAIGLASSDFEGADIGNGVIVAKNENLNIEQCEQLFGREPNWTLGRQRSR